MGGAGPRAPRPTERLCFPSQWQAAGVSGRDRSSCSQTYRETVFPSQWQAAGVSGSDRSSCSQTYREAVFSFSVAGGWGEWEGQVLVLPDLQRGCVSPLSGV